MATKAITRYRTRTVRVRSRRRGKAQLPGAVLAGLAVGMVPTISQVMSGGLHYNEGLKQILFAYTGFNPWSGRFEPFNAMGLQRGLVPLVAGVAIHKLVGQRLGINRMLKNAGVPLIGI